MKDMDWFVVGMFVGLALTVVGFILETAIMS